MYFGCLGRYIAALDGDERVACAGRVDLKVQCSNGALQCETRDDRLTLGRFLQPMTARVTRPISNQLHDDAKTAICEETGSFSRRNTMSGRLRCCRARMKADMEGFCTCCRLQHPCRVPNFEPLFRTVVSSQ
jgi:hypothetical protein